MEHEETAFERGAVATVCRELAARGVALGGSGNVSLRVGDLVLVTRSGLRFETATADDICVVDAAGRPVSGARPSSETGLHLGIYRTGQAGAVVHTHGRAAVALGLVVDEVPPVHYSILRLGGRVPTVPYLTFGSAELAAAVGAAIGAGPRAVLLRNHGSVACGSSLAEAVEHAELTEWLCETYLSARALGDPAVLSPAELRAVVDQSARLSYGQP